MTIINNNNTIKNSNTNTWKKPKHSCFIQTMNRVPYLMECKKSYSLTPKRPYIFNL